MDDAAFSEESDVSSSLLSPDRGHHDADQSPRVSVSSEPPDRDKDGSDREEGIHFVDADGLSPDPHNFGNMFSPGSESGEGREAESVEPEPHQPAEAVINDCMWLFRTPDFILEPDIFSTLSKYFQAGGDPASVINALSDNYVALSQISNIMSEWLSILGSDGDEINSIFETHLQNLIIKNFDPRKADTIFSQNQRSEGQIEWLPDVISVAPWRSLIYRLSEQYPECLMLNFAIKLISDAGYQNEISRVTTATQQLDIFSRVLCTAVNNVLVNNVDSLRYQKSIEELAKIVLHGEHTYLYTQALLHCLAEEPKGGVAAVRIGQELREALQKHAPETTDIALILHNSKNFNSTNATHVCNPSIIQAMHSMMSRNSLNPADISLLYNYYNGSDPPPIEIIRDSTFLDLIIAALFKPKAKLNVDHRPKYIFLLAYACSVPENNRIAGAPRRTVSKEESKGTQQAIETAYSILSECPQSGDLPLADLQSIFQCLRYPVVAAGLLYWLSCVLMDLDYFRSHPEPMPVNFALLDEIASLHPLLHNRVFTLLINLFETEHEGVEVLVQLERRKTLIDRLVHLLSSGHALPVANYMRQKLMKNDADVSLLRYFVTETLEVIAPPYSAEFVEYFRPLVENADISRRETMSEDKWDAVKSFSAESKNVCS